MNGYIAVNRKILDNPVVMRDGDYLAVWLYILLHANAFDGHKVIFDGEIIELKKGQFTTGRKKIMSDINRFRLPKSYISESKVERVLKRFESEHQIGQATDHKCRLITVLNWGSYQNNGQENDFNSDKFRTSSEQVVNTNKERKERKERDNYSLKGKDPVDNFQNPTEKLERIREEIRIKNASALQDQRK